jgi:chitosanase
VLALRGGTPLPRGLDVRLLQLGLSNEGADIRADGIFGQASVQHVKAWQKAHRHAATGIADIPLILRLTA